MWWVVKAKPRPLCPRQIPDTTTLKAGWATGPIWTSAENLALTGIQSTDGPARKESLYRLRYALKCVEIYFL